MPMQGTEMTGVLCNYSGACDNSGYARQFWTKMFDMYWQKSFNTYGYCCCQIQQGKAGFMKQSIRLCLSMLYVSKHPSLNAFRKSSQQLSVPLKKLI